jgi:diadenosine tetraphosphatase ApaH/serine/threonine PP2A family protein phosphatase
MWIAAFLSATARRQTTTNISSRKYQMAGSCERTPPPFEIVWAIFSPRVVLCGHSHQQHLIQLPDGPLILNPGSVGCPSYDDPGNNPHVSESGSPHARYAVLAIDDVQVSAEMIAIAYDWKAASARAETNGRPEWAHGLRTGWFSAATGPC